MKKLISLFSILITLLIFTCVAPTEVKAEESTWYTEAAERAGNPILLEDKQYFQGVSINSNVISDLTFMEIPFTKYTDNKTSKVQIITFTEALYRNDGENQQEVVMYVYYPTKYSSSAYPKDYIETKINFKSQKYLYGSSFVEGLTYEKYTNYMVTWTKVSSYGNIVKYSFGKYSDYYGKHEVTDILFKDYSTADTSEIQTIFDAKITRFGKYGFTENDGSEYYYKNQEFQLILNKKNTLEASPLMRLASTQQEVSHTAACVGTNVDTVSVVGETVRYTYMTDKITDFKFIDNTYDKDYVDIYYLFFNVFDDKDGNKWGKEKTITEVKLNYIEGQLYYHTYLEYTTDGINKDTHDYSLSVLESNGSIYKTYEKKISLGWDSQQQRDFYDSITTNFLENIDNESLFQKDTIKPETYEVKYVVDSLANSWAALWDSWLDRRAATYMTLFNTDSEEFKEICSSSDDYNSELLEKYQFGLVYGNKNGYVYESNNRQWLGFAIAYNESSYTRTLAAVAGVTEITYEENGEIHKVTVSENEIDNSNINNSLNQNQDDDIWKDEETDPLPPKNQSGIWGFIQKIIYFFKYTLPKWWKENQTAIIGALIAAGVVVAIVFLVRFLKPIFAVIAAKKAVEDANEKKEE